MRKFVVGIFVTIRLVIVVGIFFAAMRFIDLGVLTIGFVKRHFPNIGSPAKNNRINFYIAVSIAAMMVVILLSVVLIIIYACATVRAPGAALRNFGVIFVNVIKNYIYPEEVQDDHIVGLYSEEAEKIRMTGLMEESKEY